MLLIPCLHCGLRSQAEFRCGGQAAIRRPAPAAEVSDLEWADYLFTRMNPRGWHYERWLHVHGCGEWFNLMRHTVTQDIRGPFAIHDPEPEIAE